MKKLYVYEIRCQVNARLGEELERHSTLTQELRDIQAAHPAVLVTSYFNNRIHFTSEYELSALRAASNFRSQMTLYSNWYKELPDE